MKNGDYLEIKKVLDEVSPSFCTAKWLQVTVHLQNGMNHSCHHPVPHKTPLSEIASNPSALHNTEFKKKQRLKMLKGQRPSECDYCWRIEDAHPDNFSDRMVKSSDHWALPHLEEVKNHPWDKDISPTYLEVSFGNECQLKCAYCSPTISSGILSEHLKFGAYAEQPYFSPEALKQSGQYPYSKDDFNPYVDAFWKWWPDVAPKLEVFRITGGEPLLNPNTFQFLEYVEKNPMPKLDLAINSNLCIPNVFLDRFIKSAKNISQNNLVKKFEIYTSLDTFGEQAEYIRFGLKYDLFMNNVRKVLRELPNTRVIFMSTFNALSIPRYTEFLKAIHDLKKEFPQGDFSQVELSIPYLRYPPFMAANVLPQEFHHYVERSLDYMMRNSHDGPLTIFSAFEIGQLRRILEWLKHDQTSPEALSSYRSSFYSFFKEYDLRKNLSFTKTYPELAEFYQSLGK